jgi:hypothetical protein
MTDDGASTRPVDERPSDAGGVGGSLSARHSPGRLEARALAEHWPISPEDRTRIIDNLLAIVTDPKAKRRDRTAAARALLSASSVNLAAVTAAVRAQEHEELVARLAELEQRLVGGRDLV